MSKYRFIHARAMSRSERSNALPRIVSMTIMTLAMSLCYIQSAMSQCSTNQQFESGDFFGWSTIGQASNASVSCAPFRHTDEFDLLTIDDSCFALHSFAASESGTVASCYTCTFANCEAALSFDYALAYDTRGGAGIDNLFEVTVIDNQGNLVTVHTEAALPNTLEIGSSGQIIEMDLSSFECQNIQLCFTTTVPTPMLGEVAVGFDNVNLSDNTCSVSALTCLNQINLSLDENCNAEVSPQMLFPQTLSDPSQYKVVLTDAGDNILTGTALDISHLNTTVTYNVSTLTESCNTLNCWGNINVEYKFEPIFNGCTDLTLSCAELDMLPPPEVSGGSNCIAQTFTINLINETSEDITDCDSPYTNIVTRTFEATDGNGLSATCTQNILLEKVDFTGLQFPQGTTSINCSDLDSYLTYELEGQVIPLPWVTESGTDLGVPYLSGGAIGGGSGTGSTGSGTGSGTASNGMGTGSGTGSGTAFIPLIPNGNPNNPDGPDAFILSDDEPPIPIDAQGLCNTFVTYTDLVFPQIGCTTKVFRTWEILEWNCGEEFSQGPASHIIEITDDEAPEFAHPADLTLTSDNDCGGEVIIPGIDATDACLNGVNVRAFTPLGAFAMEGTAAEGIKVNLIQGLNVVTYEVSDDCGNVETYIANITLKDGIQPVAICEQTTVIGMGARGQTLVSSNTFDDGSWDECSAITTCAVRMSDLLMYRSLPIDTIVDGIEYVLQSNYKVVCPLSDLNGTLIDGVAYLSEDDLCTPYVQFCCMDMGSEQMVVFRAIDAGGNSSDCMVRVEVQGFAPQITCPANLTVDCGTDVTTLDTGDVTITGDCQDLGSMIVTFNNSNLNQCRLGYVLKTFSLQTATEVLASCTQQIFVENQTVVDANIVWPADELGLTGICSEAQLSPTALNSTPIVTSTSTCSQLGYDFDDVVTGQNACLSITRTWTAIDWCSRAADGTFKTYEHVQRITTVGNSTTMVTASSPLTFVTSALDCQRNITVSATASSGCTSSISWSYSLINVTENRVVANGSDFTYTGVLPVGEYRMSWTASDGCNETGSFNQSIFVESTKAPKPVCLTSYTKTVGAGETATILPSDIDAGSSHQCYPTNQLILSFSEDGSQNTITHTCGSSLTQQVTLWVMIDPTDDRSRKGSCVTNVTVDCGTPVQSNLVTVSGIVHTEDYQMIEEVTVDMGPEMGHETTDIEGAYAFDPMPIGGSYQVVPGKDIDYLNGVSTLDLILIQRHILNIESLDSPYKLIAADVNGSNGVDGIDLIELRKLILGIYDDLPNNTSWRFFDESREFTDATNPWSGPLFESYTIPALETDMYLDFIGVKIGDVDNSFHSAFSEADLNLRSQRWPLILTMEEIGFSSGDIKTIAVTASNYERVSGFQGTLAFNANLIEILEVKSGSVNLTKANTHFSEGAMTFSISHQEIVDYSPETILFELVVKADRTASTSIFELNSEITRAEAYRGYNEEVPLLLELRTANKSQILSAIPNPFIEYTSVEFSLEEASSVDFEFYDTQGRLIYTQSGYYEAGMSRLEVRGDDLGVSGVVYIKMVTENSVSDFKMIRL